MTFPTLLKISHPRFWIYTFGPYLLGLAAAADSPGAMVTLTTIVWGIFFLFPANLLIYGINDIFDYQTDRGNAQKKHHENVIDPSERRELVREIALFTVPFFPMLFISGRSAVIVLYGFLLFGIAYSAPPIRAKSKPFVDSLFNVLYVLPGIFGYFLLGGVHLSARLVVAAVLWCMAMHAFSAVPDIAADRRAGLHTTATVLGSYGTIVWCLVLYVVAATLAQPALGMTGVLAGDVYAILMVIALFLVSGRRLLTLYHAFPFVNLLIGMVIFLSYVSGKF